MKKIDILIVSFAPDAEWLTYCLRSLQRYASGFSKINVVFPNRDDSIMRSICINYNANPIGYDEPPPPLGHLSHNIAKTSADIYCPDATHVVHIDSDCIITNYFTPDMLFHNDKPILIRQLYKDVGPAICWKGPAEKALGFETPYETMRRMPLIHDINVYPAVRNHIEQVHNMSFSKYVLQQKPTYPCGFCEFNTIGSFALMRMPELYSIATPPDNNIVEIPIKQLWSHGGVSNDVRQWCEEVINEGYKREPPPAMPLTEERKKLIGGYL